MNINLDDYKFKLDKKTIAKILIEIPKEIFSRETNRKRKIHGYKNKKRPSRSKSSISLILPPIPNLYKNQEINKLKKT